MQGRTLGGRYRIDDLIGRGGMASVWRGRDEQLDRPVAIKLLERTALTDPTLSDRFLREARAVARLAHPNVVAIYDFGTDGTDPYLVMELVDGQSLAALLSNGPLPVDQAVSIAAQTCDGLAATHTAGVVHRDIKPGNLMITATGLVKICDFGIARLHHSAAAQATLTAPAAIIGTCEYMAPEQAAGDAVDGRTDLYALGCVLYAMLTGAPPFAGDSPMHVLSQHLNQPAVPLRARRPDVPAELDTLVGHLLAKNPTDRPADAGQVRARLAGIAGIPSGPGVPSGAHPAAAQRPASAQHAPAAGQPAPVRASAAVVPPTRTMAGPVAAEDRSRPDPRRGWLRPVVVSVAILAVLLLAAAIALLNQGPETPAGGRNTQPPPSRTSSATAQSSSPADPIAAAQLVRQEIQAAPLRPNLVKDLTKDVTEIENLLRRGNREGDAAKKVAELRDKLDEWHDDAKIEDAAYQRIAASLDQLASALPATTR